MGIEALAGGFQHDRPVTVFHGSGTAEKAPVDDVLSNLDAERAKAEVHAHLVGGS